MRVGSLFSGYGGLDMAVGGDLAWYSEIEPAACRVQEAHNPDVSNIGDITAVDWSQVEPVDVITGGYPCQPFSHAGLRKGKNDERHLWPYVRDAIRAIRPRYAVLENVRGHLTLGFADVLADLAGMGWDARWGVVRASDAGAPHGRARLFIVAYPDASGLQRPSGATGETQAARQGHPQQGIGLSPNAGGQRHGRGERPFGVEGMGGASEVSRWEAGTTWEKFGAGGAEFVAYANVSSGETSNNGRPRDGYAGRLQSVERGRTDWGHYAPAIHRWEPIVGRPAPAPTVRRGARDRLNPVFVEWLMGLPKGHVTDHGLSAAQELKMLGNGVVPQQAALALQLLAGAA